MNHKRLICFLHPNIFVRMIFDTMSEYIPKMITKVQLLKLKMKPGITRNSVVHM